MRVLIIGAGIIGVTSAYCLRRRGHEVMVIDRESGPGRETSFANGSLLTPSMPEPWNAPGCWRMLLGSLGRSDCPMQLRIKALPGLAEWGIAFLRNSNAASYQRNSIRNLRLALHSLKVMASIRHETAINYGRSARGTLRLFRDAAALDRALATSLLPSEAPPFRRLSRAETLELEPGLMPVADRLVGAIHYPMDETGDAHRFCRALAEQAQREGAEFRFDTEVSRIETHSGRVTAVVGAGQRFEADKYLVAAASYSTPLLKSVGIHLPVQPVKGYSVTFDLPLGTDALRIPVVDDDLHAVVVPLEGAIRAAGTAEFAGYDRAANPPRIASLLKLLQRVLPQVPLDPAAARPWWGLRPMSVDGVPIIGATPVLWTITVKLAPAVGTWVLEASGSALVTETWLNSTEPVNGIAVRVPAPGWTQSKTSSQVPATGFAS